MSLREPNLEHVALTYAALAAADRRAVDRLLTRPERAKLRAMLARTKAPEAPAPRPAGPVACSPWLAKELKRRVQTPAQDKLTEAAREALAAVLTPERAT